MVGWIWLERQRMHGQGWGQYRTTHHAQQGCMRKYVVYPAGNLFNSGNLLAILITGKQMLCTKHKKNSYNRELGSFRCVASHQILVET
jgi:hypothetical protein